MTEEFPPESQGKIVVFGARQIRRRWTDEQWFFSVVDIIAALTDSDAPAKYWTATKRREEKSSGFQFSTICRQLKLTSSDGKTYKTECVNTEAAFRIIQSIPSPKAEPFKRWLAEVGYQRVQEIENPELAQQRMRELSSPCSAKPRPRRSRATRTRRDLHPTSRRRGRVGRSREMPAGNSNRSPGGESSRGRIISPTSPSPNCPPSRNNRMVLGGAEKDSAEITYSLPVALCRPSWPAEPQLQARQPVVEVAFTVRRQSRSAPR